MSDIWTVETRRWDSGPTMYHAVGPWRSTADEAHKDAVHQEIYVAVAPLAMREPTQEEGDAADTDHDGECFVAAGGWNGRKCRCCGRWIWGAHPVCMTCKELVQVRLDPNGYRNIHVRVDLPGTEYMRLDQLVAEVRNNGMGAGDKPGVRYGIPL